MKWPFQKRHVPLVIGLAAVARRPSRRSEVIEGVLALLATCGDDCIYHFSAARALRNSIADHLAVSNFLMARRPRSTGVFRSGSVRGFRYDRQLR